MKVTLSDILFLLLNLIILSLNIMIMLYNTGKHRAIDDVEKQSLQFEKIKKWIYLPQTILKKHITRILERSKYAAKKINKFLVDIPRFLAQVKM